MSRYRIHFKEGSSIEGDDVEVQDGSIHVIRRDSHRHEMIPLERICEVDKSDPGPHYGGMRFDGTHEGSFSATPGSIGNSSAKVCLEEGWVYFNDGVRRKAESVKMYGGIVEFWDTISEMWRAVNSDLIKKVSEKKE